MQKKGSHGGGDRREGYRPSTGTRQKIEKCIEFFKKNNERWPKQQENKNYPLENGETFDLGTFWKSVKSGKTSISEDLHKEIVKLDSTVVIKNRENKKRKREI